MKWKIPLFKQYWDEEDINSVEKVIRRGTYWANGPEIMEFELQLAEYIGSQYALAFNSGTSALHTLLLSYDVKQSDEIIVPSFTFISTANCVAIAGAKPIFAEIENKSYGLDSEDVKEKITKKTKAIIPVHYGGSPCKDIKALKEIASDHNLLLIEDAAESLGSKIDNKMVGTYGHSSMFSFCQNKVITAGEGGAITTDSKAHYEKMKIIRSHGRMEKGKDYFSTIKAFDYTKLGYNYRIPTICAGLLLSQLKKINKIIQLRRKKAEYYNKELGKQNEIKIPINLKGYHHVYQLYTIQVNENEVRDKLQQYLEKSGIMTRVYFEPIHLKTYYREKYNYKIGDLPNTEEISKKVVTLPLYPTISNKEMDYVIEKIKGYYR